MRSFASLAAISALASPAFAHTIFQVSLLQECASMGTHRSSCVGVVREWSGSGPPHGNSRAGLRWSTSSAWRPFCGDLPCDILQPIMDVTSNDIICNGGINPYHQPISQAVIPVPAGASVTAEWHHSKSTLAVAWYTLAKNL